MMRNNPHDRFVLTLSFQGVSVMIMARPALIKMETKESKTDNKGKKLNEIVPPWAFTIFHELLPSNGVGKTLKFIKLVLATIELKLHRSKLSKSLTAMHIWKTISMYQCTIRFM